MPFDEVLPKFGKGNLHAGSKGGKPVTDKKQAVAIMLSEKRKAAGGDEEYQSRQSRSSSQSKAALKGLKKVKP